MHKEPPPLKSRLNTGKAFLISGFILVAYLLYALTVSLYKNYQLDLHIQQFQEKNEQIARENEEKLKNYKYYTSASYIEKMAKQNLNLVNPGEEVIIVPKTEIPKEIPMEEEENNFSYARRSNPSKWLKFIFDTNPFK